MELRQNNQNDHAKRHAMNHPAALARIRELLDHPAVQELNELSQQVAAYEAKHHPLPLPTLAEAMKFRREQTGETVKQISGRASLSVATWYDLELGNWTLDLEEARKLHSIGIPAEVILQYSTLATQEWD